MITEVGIPTSVGTSHSGYNDRWHGHMTELDQAKHVSDMVTHLVEDGPWPVSPSAPLSLSLSLSLCMYEGVRVRLSLSLCCTSHVGAPG
jgi:hypothetical protein